ncbi:UBX domain-containing protein 4 [Spea bombifrons]|uniref:UBX domain-containing protein 4 n=1 Tax=Spea bombifrons TaxID=233779 RepID=UPI00234927FB|nr:UBX domain-containing protein 4 [Spea bombifrons]
MLWFQGSIPEAIGLAKQRGAVFVVFVAGDDEPSTQMAESWGKEEVVQVAADGIVAIRIDSKSETCMQFSQIYPVVCVPSSFFIGESGIPLEVIAGSLPPEELKARISKVKEMHKVRNDGLLPNANMPTASFAPAPQPDSSPDDVQPAQSQPESPASSPTVSTESPTDSPKESGESEAAADLQSGDSQEEKVQRLTQKLEERRELKKKEEEQSQIRKEIERRKTGKELIEFKRKHEDEVAKKALEERNRDKAEEKAARERVKQQIAQDRADRAARFAKSKEELEAQKQAELQARQAALEARKEAAQKERSHVARIQFRLPDGSSFTNQFPSESSLEEARRFAAQTVGSAYGDFSLATMFPRREFTKEDYEKSLQSLELAPSASIVLLPARKPARAVVPSSEGAVWGVLGTILYPLLAVWRFLSSFLFSSPPPSQSSDRSAHPQQDRTDPSTAGNAEPKRETVRKRVLEKRTEEFKREGKVYRLRTQDDDDDNNTWNGNSTQQM